MTVIKRDCNSDIKLLLPIAMQQRQFAAHTRFLSVQITSNVKNVSPLEAIQNSDHYRPGILNRITKIRKTA